MVRRATFTAPRTLAARIAQLEAKRMVEDERRPLLEELIELTKNPAQGVLIAAMIAQMLIHSSSQNRNYVSEPFRRKLLKQGQVSRSQQTTSLSDV